MKKVALIISCEHAVDTVPDQYLSLFIPYQALLASHRGIDFGALTIADDIAQHIPSDFVQARSTRLLVDCNKSPHHPRCFSAVTRNLSADEKEKIMNHYYWPFRNQVMALIKERIEQGDQVWHLSIHSFTPVLNEIIRNADIGLLYDPQRESEKTLAKRWKREIKLLNPEYKVRMNYPYKGTSDGFTSLMRKQYNNKEYTGIELECNQAITLNAQKIITLKKCITNSLLKLIW